MRDLIFFIYNIFNTTIFKNTRTYSFSHLDYKKENLSKKCVYIAVR